MNQTDQLPEYIMAFGLGPMEIGIMAVVLLIVFGPKRLPGLGKSMGEAIKGFKKGISEDEIDVTDSAKKIDEQKNSEEKNS